MSWVPRYLSINRLTVKNIYIFTSALFHCLSMQRKISAVSMCLLAFSRTEQTEVWYPILNVLLVYFLFSLPYIIINLNNMSSALFLRFFSQRSFTLILFLHLFRNPDANLYVLGLWDSETKSQDVPRQFRLHLHGLHCGTAIMCLNWTLAIL